MLLNNLKSNDILIVKKAFSFKDVCPVSFNINEWYQTKFKGKTTVGDIALVVENSFGPTFSQRYISIIYGKYGLVYIKPIFPIDNNTFELLT
tara:strand:- start:23 stop:298 length:276 start_codon:yes stop_codon:yes gene_type:complete